MTATLTDLQRKLLLALAEYGPDAFVKSSVIARDTGLLHRPTSFVFSGLATMGYVLRRKGKDQRMTVQLLAMPDGLPMPTEARRAVPPSKTRDGRLSPHQLRVMAALWPAGDVPQTARALADALGKKRAGAVNQALTTLMHLGYVEKIMGKCPLFRAVRDADGKTIERFPEGTTISTVNGVRFIRIPPRPAMGYIPAEANCFESIRSRFN